MTDPTTTSRSAPSGTMLTDGHSTKIAFSADPDVEFWEKTVQPSEVDGGEKIPITTMHNTTVETFAVQALYTTGDITATVAYDPAVLDSILALVNVKTSITVHHPNGDTWDYWGALRQFTPQENSRGSQPEAQVVISTLNSDTDMNEVAPNYKTSSGTD